MKKKFNATGLCVSEKHYMVNIENKLQQIESMIDEGDYFVINRPRQFGKTTTLNMLENRLEDKYTVLSISFEGISNNIFQDEEAFSNKFLQLLVRSIKHEDDARRLKEAYCHVSDLDDVSMAITKFVKQSEKECILIIDEVDKSSNNQLFLSFLGMLRNKFLSRDKGKDFTFLSIILCGVHDIKNLKLRIRENVDFHLNSPWNIAVDFDVNMSFSAREIESMLVEYCEYNKLEMDTALLAEKIFFYTSGYPFLVSKLCKIVDENIMSDMKKSWTAMDVEQSVKILLQTNNTLFDDIVKNIENDKEIYSLVEKIILSGDEIPFTISNITISKCSMYGIIKSDDSKCKIHNKIFELFLYNHFTTKILLSNNSIKRYNFREEFIMDDGGLNIELVLMKFQQFMKEQYSHIDADFIEREGRLLFLAFIKPIINGVGFDFKEV